MSDHADTTRRALVAERQQAIDALREAAEYGERRTTGPAAICRAALVKLGEQPQ